MEMYRIDNLIKEIMNGIREVKRKLYEQDFIDEYQRILLQKKLSDLNQKLLNCQKIKNRLIEINSKIRYLRAKWAKLEAELDNEKDPNKIIEIVKKIKDIKKYITSLECEKSSLDYQINTIENDIDDSMER